MLLKYVSCPFNYRRGFIIWFPTHLPPNGYKQQLEWSEEVCVCCFFLAAGSSCECFSIALDSRFLKGLSGGSGVIVLGQVNWPRLAARLSKIGVVLYNASSASAAGRFACVKHREASWIRERSAFSAADLWRRKNWKEWLLCPHKDKQLVKKSTTDSLFCLSRSWGRRNEPNTAEKERTVTL